MLNIIQESTEIYGCKEEKNVQPPLSGSFYYYFDRCTLRDKLHSPRVWGNLNPTEENLKIWLGGGGVVWRVVGRHFCSPQITPHAVSHSIYLLQPWIFSKSLKITRTEVCPTYWYTDNMEEFSTCTSWRHDACQERCVLA